MIEGFEGLSPTDALMKVMEAFGEDEPDGFVIMWEGKNYVHMLRNKLTHSHALGLLHIGYEMVLEQFKRGRPE